MARKFTKEEIEELEKNCLPLSTRLLSRNGLLLLFCDSRKLRTNLFESM